jgi:glycosyltransferase involved in cell wall biosynthesis
MVVVSHPTGNQFVRALLSILEERELLARFFTTLKAPSSRWLRWMPKTAREQVLRRSYALPYSRISTRALRETVRLLAHNAGVGSLVRHETGWASLDAVYRDLDRAVAAWIQTAGSISAVHCYEDGAEETFRAAARRGIKCVYELPIAYWETTRRVLEEEAQRLPAWEPTLFSTRDSHEKLERKTREIDLADVVICPGRFVLDSLPDRVRAEKKCVVATYGSPQRPSSIPAARKDDKLHILFAGAMTQRKGLADVFNAMKLVDRNDVQLVVMGSPILPMNFYRGQFGDFVYEPPRPHEAFMQLMQTCDVLVLPSLVEGRALVQQEALACGLPLIVTANAGGDDLVEEGVTGFIVPVRSPEKIAEKIAWFAEHRDSISLMQDAAIKKSTAYTWSGYGREILHAGGFE